MTFFSKSTFSCYNGGCAEWGKSAFSANHGGQCAEHTSTTLEEARGYGVPEENLQHPKIQAALAAGEPLVLLRTSTNPGVALAYTQAEWLAFVLGMKDGQFDLGPEATLRALTQLELPEEELNKARGLLGMTPVA